MSLSSARCCNKHYWECICRLSIRKGQNTISHFEINFLILLEILHIFNIWIILNNYSTPCSGVLLEKLIVPHLVKKLQFSKELSSSSILSQINPVPRYLLKIYSNIIHPSGLGLPRGLFTSCFPTKALFGPLLSLSLPYVPHDPPITFPLILSSELHLVRSTYFEDPHYVMSCNPLLPFSLRPQIQSVARNVIPLTVHMTYFYY